MVSTVDIVLIFSIDVILSSVDFSNGSDHNLEFVKYLEFAFDHIPSQCTNKRKI